MIVLVIIASILFILAIINWGQSAGHSKGIFRLFNKGKTPVVPDSISGGVIPDASGSVIKKSIFGDFAFDEDYAYDDDFDYFDNH